MNSILQASPCVVVQGAAGLAAMLPLLLNQPPATFACPFDFEIRGTVNTMPVNPLTLDMPGPGSLDVSPMRGFGSSMSTCSLQTILIIQTQGMLKLNYSVAAIIQPSYQLAMVIADITCVLT